MALAAAKAAMQIGAFAGVGLQGSADQIQSLIETDRQLRRDHVAPQGGGRTSDPLGQAQDKIALVHLRGNVEDGADGGHVGTFYKSMVGARGSIPQTTT